MKNPAAPRNSLAVAARMLVFLRPLRHIMAATITLGSLSSLTVIAIPILAGSALLGTAGFPGIAPGTAALIIPLLVIARGLLRYGEQLSGHYIAFKLLAHIRDRVFAALRGLAPAKLEGREKGNLIAVITGDIELLEVFYAHTIAPAAIALIVCGAMLGFTASFHPLSALPLLGGYLLTAVIIPRIMGRRGSETARDFRRDFGALNTLALDNLRGLGEIIQYGQEAERTALLGGKSAALEEQQGRLKKNEGLTRALCDTVILLTGSLTLITGLFLWRRGLMGPEGVMLTTIAALSGFGPALALGGLSGSLVHTFAAAERVLALLDEEPLVPEQREGGDARPGAVEADRVSFAYTPGEPVLTELSLTAPEGRLLGIRGRSGCGKSTLLKLIMRFRDPDGGTLSIGGRDIRTLNTRSLRKLQGYVTQEAALFRTTIAENIGIARAGATEAEIIDAAKKASLHGFVSALPRGYDTEVGELGETLSGGEQQRIGLARAFLHDGDLLLLDEPTSNLDSLNEGIILKAIKEQSEKKTVILVSHRQSTLGIAEKIINLDE
jgi:ATP-binding cassette subfamily C protein